MAHKIKEYHAQLRLLQRTKIKDFKKLKNAVIEGRFVCIEKQSNTRNLCQATIDEEEVYFVINKKRKTIITVLTKEQAQQNFYNENFD